MYYRLNVIPLEVPPLRNRVEDIDLLVDSMMEKYGGLFRKKIRGIEQDTMNLLKQYSWPGNIRELENTVEFMINMADADGYLTRDTLPRSFFDNKAVLADEQQTGYIKPLRQIEQDYILKAVRQFGDTTQGKLAAAKHLEIGIATLYRKLHEIEAEQNKIK